MKGRQPRDRPTSTNCPAHSATSTISSRKRALTSPEAVVSKLPAVTVTVVNYNGAAFLDDCLDAVAAMEGEVAEVIVVDNASTDDSVERARRRGPGPLIADELRKLFLRIEPDQVWPGIDQALEPG